MTVLMNGAASIDQLGAYGLLVKGVRSLIFEDYLRGERRQTAAMH